MGFLEFLVIRLYNPIKFPPAGVVGGAGLSARRPDFHPANRP